MRDPAVKYTPPKDATRESWASPRPESVKDNFHNFPEIAHSTDVGKEAVPETVKPPSREKPVMVEIVNPTVPTQELLEFETYQYTLAPGARQQIIARRPNRTILQLVNMTAGKTAYIGNTSDVSDVKDSWPLASGNPPLEMKHQREVYAYNPDLTTAITIAIYGEYVLEIQ